MKKIFTLFLFAAGLTFTASAQYGNDRYNNQNSYPAYQPDQNRSYGDRQQSNNYGYGDRQQSNNNYGYSDRGYNDRGYNDRGYNRRQRNDDYRRQAEYDRMNQQYDQRINVYRNDHSLNRYERQQRIEQAERERQQKAKSFGTGVIVGGIAAIILGAIISN